MDNKLDSKEININLDGNIISITFFKITKENMAPFFITYKALYDSLRVEKNKTLRLIEGKGLDCGGKEICIQFAKFFYQNFEDIHENFLYDIEFIFLTNLYYLLISGLFIFFPPRHKYKVIRPALA